MYFSQVACIDDIGTILIFAVLFHYCANLTFVCVVKNEQETDSQDCQGRIRMINFTGENR